MGPLAWRPTALQQGAPARFAGKESVMSPLVLSMVGFTAAFTAGLAAFEQIALALLTPSVSRMAQSSAIQARRPQA